MMKEVIHYYVQFNLKLYYKLEISDIRKLYRIF